MENRCTVCGSTLENIVLGYKKKTGSGMQYRFFDKIFKKPIMNFVSWVPYNFEEKNGYILKRCPDCQLIYGVK